MNKLGITLLIIIAIFGVIPCVCAQNDDPCTRFTDINVQIMCRTMLFGGKGQEGLIAFRNEFIKKYSIPTDELPTSFLSPSTSTDKSQIAKYAFPSAPSAGSEIKSNTDKSYDRRNIFR